MNIELPNNPELNESANELVKKIQEKTKELVILAGDKDLISYFSKLQLKRDSEHARVATSYKDLLDKSGEETLDDPLYEDGKYYQVTDEERLASETFRQLLQEITELSELLDIEVRKQP